MKISPITANFKPIGTVGVTPQQVEKPAADFAQALKEALGKANEIQVIADKMAMGVVTGEVEDIHRAVAAVAQADLNFRYVLQVRNKILDAYQEIMRMQI